MGERLYIVPTWVGAASDQYHGGAGIRRRDGGGSVGLSYDKSTGKIYSETNLYKPNGAANVTLFEQIDETRATLDRLWRASKKKRIDIDELDELCELLHKHRLDVSADDYAHLHYQLESKRHAAFMDSLSPEERDEVENEERLEYVKANADRFPMLALSLGIQPSPHAIRQLKREGFLSPSGRLSNVEWWELAKTAGGWVIVVLITWKIFSI